MFLAFITALIPQICLVIESVFSANDYAASICDKIYEVQKGV